MSTKNLRGCGERHTCQTFGVPLGWCIPHAMTCCDKRSLRYVQALNQALRSCPQGPPFQAGGHARPALADGFQGATGALSGPALLRHWHPLQPGGGRSQHIHVVLVGGDRLQWVLRYPAHRGTSLWHAWLTYDLHASACIILHGYSSLATDYGHVIGDGVPYASRVRLHEAYLHEPSIASRTSLAS